MEHARSTRDTLVDLARHGEARGGARTNSGGWVWRNLAGERRSGLGLGLGASIASAKERAGLRVLTESAGWSKTWRRRAGGEDWRRCWAELAETGAGGVRRAPEFLGLTRWRPAEAFQGQRDTIVTGGEEKLNGGAFSPPSVAEEIAARSRPGVGVEGSGGFNEPW